MDKSQRVAYVLAQAALLNARVAGMQAENQQREIDGKSLSYVNEHFEDEIRNAGLGDVWNFLLND